MRIHRRRIVDAFPPNLALSHPYERGSGRSSNSCPFPLNVDGVPYFHSPNVKQDIVDNILDLSRIHAPP